MFTHQFLPAQAGIALHACLLREHRDRHALHASDTVDEERRHATHGTIIALGDTVERVAECLGEHQRWTEVIARCDDSIEMSGLDAVLIDGRTILEQCRGVTQRQIFVEHGQVVIGIRKRRRKLTRHIIVCIGIEERRLDQAKERRRRDRTSGKVLGCTVVEHVAIDLGVRHIETRGKVAHHIDVGVETYVQAVKAILACRTLSIGIAEREVIHTHVVTTLHVDVVVLGQRGMIDLLRPVSVVVVLHVVILRRILNEELERLRVGIVLNIRISTQHLRSIDAILVSIHHLGQARHQRHANTHVGINAGSHRTPALGVDDDDTVAALCTIECSSILQHRDLLDILGIDIQHQVDVVTVVDCRAILLHVTNNTVDHNERLGIGRKRVKTTNKHCSTVAGTTRTADGTHIGAERTLNIGLNSHRRGVLDLGNSRRLDVRAIVVHGAILVGNHRNLKFSITVTNGHLLAQILRSMHVERCGKRRNLDDKLARLVGHSSVVVIAQRLDHNTAERSLGGSIDTNALHLHHRIGRNLCRCLLLGSCHLIVIICRFIVLGVCRQASKKANRA